VTRPPMPMRVCVSSVTQVSGAKSVVETDGAVEKPKNAFPTAP
jgi:hypothetical protein